MLRYTMGILKESHPQKARAIRPLCDMDTPIPCPQSICPHELSRPMLARLLPEREREEATEPLLPERVMVEVTELAEADREEELLIETLGGVRGDCLESCGNLGGVPMARCLGEGAMTSLMSREMARLTSLGEVELIASASSASIAVLPLTPLIARRRSPGKSARDWWHSSSPRIA